MRSGRSRPLSAEGSPKAGPRLVAGTSAPVVMGAAAPATVVPPAPENEATPDADTPANSSDGIGNLRNAVLRALADAGHRMLTSMLEAGEWQVQGNELRIKVAASASMIDMSLGSEAKRLAIATASGTLGRPMKLQVLPGGTAQSSPAAATASNGGGRTRAEQDPVVRRMQEKFGAEIRTIIDFREKR
jgi:DNA polymerase-3 subunit gamma/tau